MLKTEEHTENVWPTWIGKEIEKFSKKPFKSGKLTAMGIEKIK
jgi:hypothetical protein